MTLNPGIYYIDRGDFSMNGGATITGTGVTLIFTSSTMTNWPRATINGGATVNLTLLTTGPTAGIVMFGDRNIPVGTSFKFNGGASQYLGGAIYFPTGDVMFAGGAGTSTSCTQLIGDTITVDRRGVKLEIGVQHGPRYASSIPLLLLSFQTQCRVTLRRRKGSFGRADLHRSDVMSSGSGRATGQKDKSVVR